MHISLLLSFSETKTFLSFWISHLDIIISPSVYIELPLILVTQLQYNLIIVLIINIYRLKEYGLTQIRVNVDGIFKKERFLSP